MSNMMDVTFIVAGIAFLLASVAYALGCERL
jgi:hypothetical protein